LRPLEPIFAAMARVGGVIVATGSGMEYGAGAGPSAEDAACWPHSPYGLARLSATLRARQLALRYGVPTRVARIFTVFGELDAPDRVVTRLIGRLRQGERVGIAPGIRRDICDVADVAAAYCALAAEAERGPVFDIFNLSRGFATPLIELARSVARQLCADSELVFEDRSMLRSHEPLAISGDSRKALARFGWSAGPISQGIERLVFATTGFPSAQVQPFLQSAPLVEG
jgi:nucleoside-diphosphate-sugar epimerase